MPGQRVALRHPHRPRLPVQSGLEAQGAGAPSDMRRLRLEDRAGVAATLQLEAGAEAGETRPENHHVHGARGLREGAQVVEGGEPQGDAGGDAQAAEELAAGEGGDLGRGHEQSLVKFSRHARPVKR